MLEQRLKKFVELVIDSQHSKVKFVTTRDESLSHILENVTDSYWDWDILNSEKFTSSHFWLMFGYDSESIENYHSKLNEIVSPEDMSIFEENLKLHFKTKGLHPVKQEIRCKHKNGSIVWIVCIGKVIEWSESGQPLRMVGIHTDITSIKELQKEQDKNLRLASIGEMASNISHEINNPLAIINVSLDWIKKSLSRPDFDLEKIIKKIDISKKNIERANSVINGLRLYSDNLQNCLRRDKKVHRVVELTISLLEDRLKTHNINVLNLTDKTSLINCDETQISYIIFNLISSSIDSIGRGSNTVIEVKSKIVNENTVIEISENKPLDDQVNSTLAEPPMNSANLGISASRSIAESHNGNLEIEIKGNKRVSRVILPSVVNKAA